MATPGRTTDTAVKLLIDGVPDDVVMTPYIDSANELVTEVCASVTTTLGAAFYTDHRLELIERWLAAHFYCIFDPRAHREKVASIHFEPQSRVDLGLDVTHYGQQAMRLDTNGGLAAMNNAMKTAKKVLPGAKLPIQGGVRWLGTKNCELPNEPSC